MRRIFLAAPFLVFIMFTATSLIGGEPGRVCLKQLKTDGSRFVDSAGRQIILRGANAGSRSKLPPFYPFEARPDFDTALAKYTEAFHDLGFNAVRLLIMYEAAEPVRGRYDEKYLRRYDAMVKAFGKRGIRVIVDSHQDIFHRRFCGDGFPDWAIGESYRDMPHRSDCGLWELRNFHYGVAHSFGRFWGNVDGIQDSYVAFFRMLAERYKDEPAVIGFEPINEPMPGIKGLTRYNWWNENRLYALYEKVADAVHEVDPGFIVFADICPLENLGSWDRDRRRPEIENLAFAPHYYDVGYVKFEWSTSDDRELMLKGLTKHIKQGRKWDVPVLVGEYGIEMQRDDAPKYIENLYSVFDELQLSATIWEASMSETLWNGRDKNIFNPDGSVRPGTVALDRPYPRATAGIIESFSFDPATGKFVLTFDENPAIDRPTEVYLPDRVYDDSPRIEIEPEGPNVYLSKEKILLIQPLEGKSRRTLTVMPRAR